MRSVDCSGAGEEMSRERTGLESWREAFVGGTKVQDSICSVGVCG